MWLLYYLTTMNDNFIRNKEFFEPKQDVVPSKSISGPKKKKQKVKTTIGNTSIDGWPQHFISLEKTFKVSYIINQ